MTLRRTWFFYKIAQCISTKKMSKIQVETDIAQYDTTRRGIIFRSSWFLPWWPIGGEDARQIFDVRNSPHILWRWWLTDSCDFPKWQIGRIIVLRIKFIFFCLIPWFGWLRSCLIYVEKIVFNDQTICCCIFPVFTIEKPYIFPFHCVFYAKFWSENGSGK